MPACHPQVSCDLYISSWTRCVRAVQNVCIKSIALYQNDFTALLLTWVDRAVRRCEVTEVGGDGHERVRQHARGDAPAIRCLAPAHCRYLAIIALTTCVALLAVVAPRSKLDNTERHIEWGNPCRQIQMDSSERTVLRCSGRICRQSEQSIPFVQPCVTVPWLAA